MLTCKGLPIIRSQFFNLSAITSQIYYCWDILIFFSGDEQFTLCGAGQLGLLFTSLGAGCCGATHVIPMILAVWTLQLCEFRVCMVLLQV